MGASCAAPPWPDPLPDCECESTSTAPSRVRLRVGCASSLFVAPLQRAIGARGFMALNVNLLWVRCPPEAAATMAMLSSGVLDVALVFTEDAVHHAANSSQVRICSTFVDNPRTWGLYALSQAATKPKKTVTGLQEGLGARIAALFIGRLRNCGRVLQGAQRVFYTMRGAYEAMLAGQVTHTIWEMQYAHSLVHRGDWTLVNQVTTPWPSMMVVASREALHSKSSAIRSFVDFSNLVCEEFKSERAGAAAYVAGRFGIEPKEAVEWLDEAVWSCTSEIEESTVSAPLECLRNLGIVAVEKSRNPSRLLARDICAFESEASPLPKGVPAESSGASSAGGDLALPFAAAGAGEWAATPMAAVARGAVTDLDSVDGPSAAPPSPDGQASAGEASIRDDPEDDLGLRVLGPMVPVG